jgi:hypothetical protein
MGPRAEILLQSLMATGFGVYIGLKCLDLVIQTEVTGQIAYAWWAPILAMSIPGLSIAADVIAHRQYTVLTRLGDLSAPEVYWMSSLLVGIGHTFAVIVVLVAVIRAEILVWNYYNQTKQPLLQQRYLLYTVLGNLFTATAWILAGSFKHHLR